MREGKGRETLPKSEEGRVRREEEGQGRKREDLHFLKSSILCPTYLSDTR
jgi:phage terminase small subunit